MLQHQCAKSSTYGVKASACAPRAWRKVMIKTSWTTRFAVSLLLSAVPATAQTPLGPGFTYQGQLKQNGQPFTGAANLAFKLFDAPSGGSLLGTQTLNGVNVSTGLFTVLLNANSEFGANAFSD